MAQSPLTVELDVTDALACQDAVTRTRECFGRIDIVWANAGIASGGPLHLADPAAWRRTIEVNLIGSYNTLRAALPAVIESKGYVAVTASITSFAHPPQLSAYSATKAGVEAMCNSVRIELASHGVDVGTIHPSWIDTDMVREGDDQFPYFRILRNALRPPLDKTHSPEAAARRIAVGFEERSRRVFVPASMRVLHALRPLITTRFFERDERRVAPRMEEAFLASVANDGARASSISERIGGQLQD